MEMAGLLAENDDHVVLVAGQALAVWGAYYLANDIPLDQLSPLASRDIDFYETRTARVKKYVVKLKEYFDKNNLIMQVNYPGPDDFTINVALMSIRSPGETEPLIIDFLNGIGGVSSTEMGKGADRITIGNDSFWILNPAYCLKSRIYNLMDLYPRMGKSAEKMENEEARVKLGILIVKYHLLELIYHVPDGERIAADRVKIIIEIAKGKLGKSLWRKKGISVLDAIPDHGLNPKFYQYTYIDAARKIGLEI